MATRTLSDRRVAIIATDGFEYSELVEPKKAIEMSGGETHVISLKPGTIRGWSGGDWADSIDVDVTIDEARPEEYEALLLPGGTISPDKLRQNEQVLDFVRHFFREGKPVAAICHGPQILIDCDVLDGRKVTSVKAIANDLKNAGASWVDRECVVDQSLVTSRTPDDLPPFIESMLEKFAEGARAATRAV